VATDADQSRLLREAWPRQHVAKYWLLIGLGPKPNNNHYLCLHYCFGLLAVSPRYKGKYLAIFAGICFFNISVPGIVVVCYIVCCDYF